MGVVYPAAPYRTCTDRLGIRPSKILPFRYWGRQPGIPGANCSCRAAACGGQPGKPNARLGSIRRRLTPSAALWLRRGVSRDESIYRMHTLYLLCTWTY